MVRVKSVGDIVGATFALQNAFARDVRMRLAAVARAFSFIKNGRLVPIMTCVQVLREMPTLIVSGYAGFELVPRMGALSADL